jgi:Ser/Thr protein kinase RdoA (MazF antagonist)
MNPKPTLPSESDITTFGKYQQTLFFSKIDGGYPTGILQPHVQLHKKDIGKIVKETLSKDVIHVVELSRRTLHYVYRAKTTDSSYIIRINASGMFFREFQFFVEQWITGELAKRQIPHVDIDAIDISRSVVPFDFEIMEEARGRSLFDIGHEDEDILPYIKKLGTFIAHVHEIKTKGYGSFDIFKILNSQPIGIHPTWQSYLKLNLDKHLEYTIMTGILTVAESDAVKDALKILEHIPCDTPSLLHGDIANHNAFTDGKVITSLIDWEDAISGDPIFDIAYYATGCYGHDAWASAFLEGYISVAKLPEDYEKRFWAYYLRVAVVKAIVRFRYKTSATTALTAVRERILLGLSKLSSFS